MMGEFIGGIGAAFIMAAAAAVIVKFLLDVNVIKSREMAVKYGKISLVTIIIGAVYISAAVLMYNEFHGRTNFFDFDKIFGFLGSIRPTFGNHGSVGMLISLILSCVSACLLYSMISKTAGKENTENIMLLPASIPYAFMLFIPTFIPLVTAFIVSAAYILSKKNMKYASGIVRLIENKLINNAVVFRIIITVFILFNGAALCVMIRGL